jgi:uncharacterized protein (TIGR03086 family)
MTDMTQQSTRPSALDDLAGVLGGVEEVIGSITPDQAALPTPCDDLDVGHLVDHVLGWSHSYAARLTGAPPLDAPDDHRAGDDPGAELHECAQQILSAYREDTPASQQLPVGILLMDYLGHGWDLAVATGQPVRFPESAAARALAAGRQMLTPENRGENFGPEVQAAPDAKAVDRLVSFLGRDPGWSPPA